MSENEKQFCDTCKWHGHDAESGGWVCVNSDSDHIFDNTACEDCCKEWEGK